MAGVRRYDALMAEKLFAERMHERFTSWLDKQKARVRGEPAPRPKDGNSEPPKSARRYSTSPVPEEWKRQIDEGIPAYPPFRQGLPVVPADHLIASQKQLVQTLYGAVGVSTEDWKKLYLPVLHSYAAYVHLLPASEGNHHRGAGGLLRHGIEAALYAVRRVDGGDSLEKSAYLMLPDERKKREECFRLAVFCAAILHDIGKPVTDMQIYDLDNPDTIWNPALLPSLIDWAAEHRVERYQIRWRPGRMDKHRHLGMAVITHLLHRPTMGFLSAQDPLWSDLLFRSVNHDETGANKVRDFATFGDRESVRLDLRTQGVAGNDMGVPVERFLLDAMRSLMFDGSWKVNESNATVLVCALPDEGGARQPAPGTLVAALIWPKAGRDIVSRCEQDGVPGIPRDPQILADMLLDRGIALPAREAEENQARIPFWFAGSNDRAAHSGIESVQKQSLVGQRVLVLAAAEYLVNPPPPDTGEYLLYSAVKAGGTLPQAPAAAGGGTTGAPHQQDAKAGPSHAHTPKSASEKPAPVPRGKANGPAAPEAQQRPEHGLADDPADGHGGTGSRYLRVIARELLTRQKPSNLLIPAGDQAMLRFPDAFSDLGIKPLEVLKAMHAEHLILPSPDDPEMLAQTHVPSGQGKPFKVAVLSPAAMEKFPCFGVAFGLVSSTESRVAFLYLIDQAPKCEKGKYVANGSHGAGVWYLPLDWTIRTLRAHFKEDRCPERYLYLCDIGPAGDQSDGLFVRVTTGTGDS